jgi:hypothetical protein
MTGVACNGLEYRAIMAASTEIADPWASAAEKPVPITKSWRHDTDPSRRRATFGVRYPLLEIVIEKSDDLHSKLPARSEQTGRRSVPGVRIDFQASNLKFRKMAFRECKFHRPDGSRVVGALFENCNFERCILGGTHFHHVTFKDCKFSRCDFGDSEFDECNFINCIFEECTVEHASFLATEISPTALLRGVPPPVYNYGESVPDWEPTADEVAAEWLEVRRKLAAQVLRSNTDIHHRENSDLGLLELKRAEVKSRYEAFRAQSLKNDPARLLADAVQIFIAWLVLKVTKGGTSLFRLFLAAMFFVVLYALLLSSSHVKFMSQDCHFNSFQLSLIFQQLARAASLFLAFGYTAFSGGTLDTVLLTVAAFLGLWWYALVAEVVIHRVYR